jgi:hypothetical protein
MISDHVMRGPNVIRFDHYTYLGKGWCNLALGYP